MSQEEPPKLSRVKLWVTPVELKEANAFIAKHHRHHKPVVGHRFSIGTITEDGIIHGVCVIGRPVARLGNKPRNVLEVTRVATDGTPNACSILYAAAARAGLALGYKRIQTFTLPEEVGASLRASGWVNEGIRKSKPWKHSDGKERRTDQPSGNKVRWSKDLSNRPEVIDEPLEGLFTIGDKDE